MKITKSELKKIIKEEVLKEQVGDLEQVEYGIDMGFEELESYVSTIVKYGCAKYVESFSNGQERVARDLYKWVEKANLYLERISRKVK